MAMITLAASGSELLPKGFPRTSVHQLRVGYEAGDPYAEFLPPAVEVNAEGDSEFMRAVVFVTEETRKGTARSPQEYANPLLILSGQEYASISFVELHTRICDALRGKGPKVQAQLFTADGDIQLILSDGRILDMKKGEKGNL
jgi:hypothetical protein